MKRGKSNISPLLRSNKLPCVNLRFRRYSRTKDGNRYETTLLQVYWNTGKQAMASFNGLFVHGSYCFAINVNTVIGLQKKSIIYFESPGTMQRWKRLNPVYTVTSFPTIQVIEFILFLCYC